MTPSKNPSQGIASTCPNTRSARKAWYARWLIRFAPLIVCCATGTTKGTETTLIDFSAAPASYYLDRWMYPFNATPGQRIQAPTFAAIGSTGFDERDGQLLLAVNTQAAGITPGLLPASYYVQSLVITVTETSGDYVYDGTSDDFRSYLPPENPIATTDLDPGRPLELFGAGFRNDFTGFGWPDGATSTSAPVFSAASSFGSMGRATRNVFAADAAGSDVSNHVDSLNGGASGYNPDYFAVGQASHDDIPLAAGDVVVPGTELAFHVNLQDPSILSYVQQGLAEGELGFVVSSLHETEELGAGAPYPNLATANHFAFAGPQFEITWELREATPGDFDGDGQLTATDIDLLSATIRSGTFQDAMDLDHNQQLDGSDRRIWVELLAQTSYGDANLDRAFGSSDLVQVFQAGEYEDSILLNSGWGNGDWDGDGEFDTTDFLLAFQTGGYETAASARAVPEPSCSLPILGLLALHLRRRLWRSA